MPIQVYAVQLCIVRWMQYSMKRTAKWIGSSIYTGIKTINLSVFFHLSLQSHSQYSLGGVCFCNLACHCRTRKYIEHTIWVTNTLRSGKDAKVARETAISPNIGIWFIITHMRYSVEWFNLCLPRVDGCRVTWFTTWRPSAVDGTSFLLHLIAFFLSRASSVERNAIAGVCEWVRRKRNQQSVADEFISKLSERIVYHKIFSSPNSPSIGVFRTIVSFLQN